jgi:hypothetical protein
MIADSDDSVEYHFLKKTEIAHVFDRIEAYEAAGWTVGLTSLVMTQNGMKHLLMLDFSIPLSKEAEENLSERIKIFNQSGDVDYRMDGFLIRTNVSYHYLGAYVTSEESLLNFFGSSLLFRHSNETGFVTDDRWLGRSIKRKFGVLRLGKKNDVYPELIREIK